MGLTRYDNDMPLSALCKSSSIYFQSGSAFKQKSDEKRHDTNMKQKRDINPE